MQQIVNAAPTAGEGDRVRRMISALITAGVDAGYLVNSRLAKVHWQAGDRALPAPSVTVAGESAQWVDPAEIPSDEDVAKLGRFLAAGTYSRRGELMASAAAAQRGLPGPVGRRPVPSARTRAERHRDARLPH
jgi:hypothetical protein